MSPSCPAKAKSSRAPCAKDLARRGRSNAHWPDHERIRAPPASRYTGFPSAPAPCRYRGDCGAARRTSLA
eukprot:14779132-Alexandrium_andersonii.AAC.1